MNSDEKSEFEIAIEKGTQSPWQSAPPIESALIAELSELGVVFPEAKLGPALEIISRAFDVAGDLRAGEAMNRIAAKLDGTAGGLALQRILTGSPEPVRAAAIRAGVSHVCLLKHEKKLRKRLGVTIPRPCRGKRFADQKLKTEKL